MATMTVAEAKNRFSDVLRRAEYGGERVVVERHGKPVAAIVSTDDLRRLEATDDKADLRDARAALAEAKQRWDRSARDGSAEVRIGPSARRAGASGRSSASRWTNSRQCEAFSKDLKRSSPAVGAAEWLRPASS